LLICEAVEPDGKTCRACKQYTAMSEYHLETGAPDGHRRRCKSCEGSQQKARRTANPGRAAASTRKSKLKKSYGITPEEFDTMLEDQYGACSLCGSTSPGGRDKRFHVDHDHATGAVRSLLCSSCNVGLGHFRDNPALMRRAAAYVEHHAKIT
jgi:hypothetical protein